MNVTILSPQDYLALSPFFILLAGGLILLLIESFMEKACYRLTTLVTLVTLAVAGVAVFYAPASTHTLITPWLKFDALSRFFALFFLSVGFGTVLLAVPFFQKFKASSSEYLFLLLTSIAGLIMVSSSADFLTLFIGIETLSVSLYIACGYVKMSEGAQESSIKYFLTGAVTAAFLVYGIALLYGATGTLNFDQLLPAYKALAGIPEKTLFMCGIGLIAIGIAFKAALVPFHFWAPDAYAGASNPITGFMAIATKAGAFAAFIRVFDQALPDFNVALSQSLSVLAYATLIYANFVAMRQFQLRRFFAYSGIAHAGLLLLPVIAGGPEATFAIEFYLAIYALATLAAFAVLACIDDKEQGTTLDDLNGLATRSPWLAGLFTLSFLTLAGIPPTAGFFAKFYVFKVAYEAGYYGLVVVGLFTTVLSAYTYLRIITKMFGKEMEEEKREQILFSYPAAILGVVTFVGILWMSLYPGAVLNWTQ